MTQCEKILQYMEHNGSITGKREDGTPYSFARYSIITVAAFLTVSED